MPVRCYMDVPVPHSIAAQLRRCGVDLNELIKIILFRKGVRNKSESIAELIGTTAAFYLEYSRLS